MSKMREAKERQAALESKLAVEKDLPPRPAEELAGEIVAEDETEPRGIVGRIAEWLSPKERPRLALNPNGQIVEVDPAALSPIERAQLSPLSGTAMLRRLYRETIERIAVARQNLDLAQKKLKALEQLSKNDGLGWAFEQLGKPKPESPAAPDLVRVRANRPFIVMDDRASRCSTELKRWLAANDGVTPETAYPPRRYAAQGRGHVLDVPREELAGLLASGAAELVDATTPKCLPDGTPIP